MPLFSEHISNMYYSGSPSYSSPSYGYKSSYNPLGTSYSASYLSPGGSYSNHSSLSSYSRAPLSSRWIPGMSRSYSPMLTPISERVTASPIRINSPRRIPISKRCYGTPSYIQRPININTESIDVSRERYRPKPAEMSQSPSASSLLEQKVDPVKDNEKSPFMPRVDGKPETGIDSSPGIQRSTIKRGRTVVRLHTIKRKDKDSPRKSLETLQLQESNINKQDLPETLIDDFIPEESKESLSWREKLCDDLVYVDKKEKKSLGTKLVEKFLVKDVAEKDKLASSDLRIHEATSHADNETLLPSFEVPSHSKSPDRRCSMEMLAEQSSLLDSLIRGENLSTATLDLSKVGIADETENKIASSNSIKRRKTDDKGNPLKTTKSDHSLHDNLNKSLKGNSKTFTKRRSLKKSQSGGSISRLDSITEFPKESVDLPVIQENKFSPKQTKIEQKPKLKTKITASVEISPPTSPLKFRIENVTVEEKHHTPKKEISFSYDVDEISTQDVTLQSPKTTIRRTKERNSIKKNTKKNIDTVPISPEPDDGNFWAKIGKRETVYLIKRKENIEAAKEKNKRAHYCFDVDDESGDVTNNSNVDTSITGSNLPNVPEVNKIFPKPQEVNGGDKKELQLNTVSTKLEKSRSSDNMQKIDINTHTSSLKENTNKTITELKPHNFITTSNEIIEKKTFRQETDIKEDSALYLDMTKTSDEKSILTSEIKPNLKRFEIVPPAVTEASSSAIKLVQFEEKVNASTNLDNNIKQKSGISETNENCVSEVRLNPLVKDPIQMKSFSISSGLTQVNSDGKHLEKDSNPIDDIITKTIDTTKADLNFQSATAITPLLQSQPKSESTIIDEDLKPIFDKTETIDTTKNNIDANLSEKTSIPKKIKPTDVALIIQNPVKKEDNIFEKDSKLKLLSDDNETTSTKSNIDNNLLTETLTDAGSKPNSTTTVSMLQAQAMTDGKNMAKDSKTIPEQGKIIIDSKCIIDTNMSSQENLKPVIAIKTLETQTEIENKYINKIDSTSMPVNLETVESAKSKSNVNLSADISVESKVKTNQVSTLQTQAKQEVDDKKIELAEKCKQAEKAEDVNSNMSKQRIVKSTKKNVLTEKTTANSKKRIKKVQVLTDKSKDVPVKINNDKKDKICETCKKSMGSDSSSTSKLDTSKGPSTSKSSQGNDKVIKINTQVDIPISKILETNTDLDSSVANLSDLNSKPETSASTSQVPIVINTNIPNKTVASDIDQVQTSVPSQENTGEENKAENDIKGDENPKPKQTSIKKVAKISAKKVIKEEKPAKPLIATPRPLLKRAPQVIHSDSSDSSSEEDSSEEEESDASENSGEFYECETNPDGRTSTGSNDSGFDSSAPTSPASFLQIKKGGGDSPGPSSSNAPSQLPATDVGDSELELEQSTAYGIFRKTGKFTPPARSIPRFRKYNIEDFQFIKVLGKGSFGKVLLAELRDTEYYYAVKCLKKDVVLEDDDVECTLIERKVLALGTNHPYLCHLFATFQTDSHLFFVMEYLNGGDLMFHIQQSGRFPEARARFYAAEIVSGLKFLHKRGIVYRDLKLDNILLDFDGHVRIADFGMCKLQIYLDKTADTFCGTPDYMAPEIIKGLKYNQTVDWWSFGVLLYEMLIGQSPFSGCDEDELFWSICNEMPSYPRFLSKEGLTILTRLLDKDARTRLGGTECMHGDVREQDFFHPVHWDKLERRELETPFKPRVRHPLDTQYFDRAFTGERPRLTTVEPHVLRSMDQEPFRGFSYTNPNATDR